MMLKRFFALTNSFYCLHFYVNVLVQFCTFLVLFFTAFYRFFYDKSFQLLSAFFGIFAFLKKKTIILCAFFIIHTLQQIYGMIYVAHLFMHTIYIILPIFCMFLWYVLSQNPLLQFFLAHFIHMQILLCIIFVAHFL